MQKGLLTVYPCIVSYFTHNVSFYTQCVISLTVCNFTHSVLFYSQCVILLTVWNFSFGKSARFQVSKNGTSDAEYKKKGDHFLMPTSPQNGGLYGQKTKSAQGQQKEH